MTGGSRVFEDDFNTINSKQERGVNTDASRENSVAKIKVVVC